MKRLLPTLFTFVVLFLTFFVITPISYSQQLETTAEPIQFSEDWVADKEVTFVGKTASRANDFLEWTLQNYHWISISPGETNPLSEFWSGILRIVLVMIVLFVLVSAFVIIVTRGQSLTFMRFIPRLIIIILLIFFSFALVRFLYQFFDIIQGFFLTVPDSESEGGRLIGSQDLLYIGFDYGNFIGYRKAGVQFDESAYISLLLVKITSITYYVMIGILLIRKIILWFFIIISPVFPLLLFFKPLRNTAKIWVGEFFRWLLYAPLFAIFLNGLVGIWRKGIPLPFDFSQVGTEVYPTAINILLAGPGQQIGDSNSVNLNDTFALYVVALLMLWVVILLPWILLQIFLHYINNLTFTETALYRRISTSIPFINNSAGKGPDISPQTSPQGPTTTGLARSIPLINRRTMQIPVKRVTVADSSKNIFSANSSTGSNISSGAREVVRLASLSIPKMRDIARLESASITRNQPIIQQKTEITNKLNQISSPSQAPVQEREKFTTIKERLIQMHKSGDSVASSILNASKVGSPESKDRMAFTLQQVLADSSMALTPQERQKSQEIKQELLSAQQQGNPLATYLLDMSSRLSQKETSEQEKSSLIEKIKEKLFSEKDKGNKLADKILSVETPAAISQVSLPSVNRVQQVSIDEYEEVKNIWKENYQNMELPTPTDGKPLTKEEWIQNDVAKINETINLLSSPDQSQVQRGMEMVFDILPFLLIGGFSKAEVIAYLKAKQAAGKEILGNSQQKEEEENTLLDNSLRQNQSVEEMAAKRELPLLDDTKNEGNRNDTGTSS